MLRTFSRLTFVFAVALCIASAQQPAAPAELSETPEIWFVELQSAPAVEGGSLGTLIKEKQAFRDEARKAGVRYSERWTYNDLFNGLSIKIDRADLSLVATLPGVKAIYPVATMQMPDPQPVGDTYLATALEMTGAKEAYETLHLSGKGIRVGVIDTGIDYTHPDLGGCFGPQCRVVAGYDIYDNDANPMDCYGHGTHVAGIIGANGVVRGVAPDVQFGAYKVASCSGSITQDAVLKGYEMAYADGMDVVNLSLGWTFQWPDHPVGRAATRLVNKGVVVVASIGNSGANGIYSGGAPGVGTKVIGVASFDNTYLNEIPYFTVSPDSSKIGYLPTYGAGVPPAPTSGTLELMRPLTNTCAAQPANSLAGKVALIEGGSACLYYWRVRYAELAGAVGVVLYGPSAGWIGLTFAQPGPPLTIPAVTISREEATLLISRLNAGPVMMTWTAMLDKFPNALGNLISPFSSFGLSPDLALKPDLGAPGGWVRSTLPGNSYGVGSGTSMSSPHVAGAAALLLEAKPHTPSQAVGGILMNNAQPRPFSLSPSSGYLEPVHRQGAGMVNIPGAVLATTKVEPWKLSLGEVTGTPAKATIWMENNKPAGVTYALSATDTPATGPSTFTPAYLPAVNQVTFAPAQIHVPAGAKMPVDVTISPDAALPAKSVFGGYILISPVGGGAVTRVPYSGFKGDYQSIVVLTPTPNGFPWLARYTGTTYVKESAGAVYRLNASNEVPYIAFHLDHQVSKLRVEVFDAATGKAWGRGFDSDEGPRSSTATSFFVLSWAGVTANGNHQQIVPNGSYVLKLSILKAMGDDNNPAHWEYWTTPPFNIQRP